MPARLSKFAVPAKCKDYVHPWTDSCISSTAGLGLHAVQESFKIYSTLYILSLLMKRKVPSRNDLKKTVHGIIQSTVFLSWSSFAYAMFLCSLRRMFSNFNIFTVSFVPSFLSSLSAIILERPSRRVLLCLYVSNIATETLFRMGVWRGYFTPVPRAEVYIFAASMATLLYLYRSKKNNKDSIFGIIRFVLGQYEEINHMKRLKAPEIECKEHGANNCNCKKQSEINANKKKYNIIQRTIIIYRKLVDKLKAQAKLSRHATCPHPKSCIYYVLRSSSKMFSIGVAMQLLLKSILQAKRIIRRPKLLRSIIFRKDNLKLGLFLGGFAGLYKLLSCALRRAFDDDSSYFAIPAGFLASVTFMFYPNNTIALTVMWKALHNGADLDFPVDLIQKLYANGEQKLDILEAVNIILKHLITLKTLNLTSNKICEKWNLESRMDNFGNFEKACQKEAKKLGEKVCAKRTIRFSDLLTRSLEAVAVFMNVEEIHKKLSKINYERRFPIYSDMLIPIVKKSMVLMELLNQSFKLLREICNDFQMPDIILIDILGYLNEQDLRNLNSLLWNNGVENEKVPKIKWFVIFLYCFSTAVLFHAAIIEPQNLRASYWKFLVTLSGGRVAAMSRIPLDEFGLGTSTSLQKVLRKTNTTDQYTYSF